MVMFAVLHNQAMTGILLSGNDIASLIYEEKILSSLFKKTIPVMIIQME